MNSSYGSGGQGIAPIFHRIEYQVDSSKVTNIRPTKFSADIATILCSDLCEVSKCVLDMTVQYQAHTNLTTDNDSSTALIGVGIIDLGNVNAMMASPAVLLSSSNTGYWKYGWPLQLKTNSVVSSTPTHIEIDLVSSTSYYGLSASAWKSYDPSNIVFAILASQNLNAAVKWTASSGSVSLLVNATCTVIYTDYR